jgi:hypothetical protein
MMGRALRWLPWLALGIVLTIQAPRWWRLQQLQGRAVPVSSATGAAGTLEHAIAEPRSKVLVFCASWCGPCTIELSRFAGAVRDGDLPADRVIAVSMDGDSAAYARAVKERAYPFRTFLDRAGLARELGVKVTPTVMHLGAGGKIEYATSGLSLLGVWRAQWFLRE